MTDDRRVALAEKVARLSPEKQRLLRERLAGAAGRAPEDELTPIDPGQCEFPLSQTQAGFWFMQQLEPDGHMFNLPSFMRFYGALDVELVRRVLAEMLHRHELLRCRVLADGPEPRLRVEPEVELPLREVDLSHLPDDEREPELRRLASLECRAPFDLGRAPLVRLLLVRERPDQSAACFTFHHIICDGWSVELFVRECLTLYLAYRAGADSPLPPLRWRYADYVAWQRRHLTPERLEAQLAFWRRTLEGAPPLVELPLDRPRPALPSRDGAVAQTVLGAEDVERVTAFSRAAGLTPFMTYAGLFGLLLARYSGQEQVLVGTPVFNRPRPEFEPLMGLFINTLVIHCDLRGDPDVHTYLVERIQKGVLDAFGHQDVPFHQVVRAVSPERHVSGSPLFQVLFSYQSYSSEVKVNADGLRVRGLEGIDAKATYDLTFELRNREDGTLAIAAEFAGELFERATVVRLLGHYVELLRAAVAQPRRSVWSVPFLPAAERRRQLHDWNRTAAEYPRTSGYAELWRAVAAARPTQPAACEGSTTLTYAALDARSDALAAHLRRHGLAPDRLALLLQERGLALLTSILAVFKAGGAYVPLDTAYPPERVAQLVRRCAAPVLLSREASRPLLEQLTQQGAWDERTQVLYPHELDLHTPVAPPSGPEAPDALAYCIFTSGSTGQPKGALIAQRGMVNHLYAKIAELSLNADDLLAATASPCFDISVWQFLAALLVGGRVSFFDDETTHTGMLFLRRLEAEGVTIAEVVPSFFRVLLEDLERLGERRPAFARLRYLLLTGEALPAPLCDRWLALYPRIPLVNAYGPTECSDDVTHHVIRRATRENGTAPIGRPIANTRIYVVDRVREPLPIGVAGEILVGGDGVGRGYLDDPARTAEAFVPDHLAGATGGRLYRTGDLGRLRADGTLDYLGRIDQQVKVRGFRIELGEIEAVLATCPGLHAAAAKACTDAAGRTRLVGYYVVQAEHEVTAEECAAHLQRRLPAYMVPQVFVRLAALPLGATGKVDRKALPDPTPAALERTRGFVPPATPTEQRLAAVWAEVIGCGRVGATDGFFELGGHSLMGTQVLSRVNAAFGLNLELRALFESETLADFAREVDGALRAAAGTALPPVERVEPREELPLSFAQQRLWFLNQFEPTPAYNIPFALRVRGPLDLDRLASALAHINARHEVLRTTFDTLEGRPVPRVQPAGAFELRRADLRQLAPEAAREQASRLAREEATRLFDLSRDPLLRVLAVRISDDETLIAAAVHHIAFDGWSVAILVRELFALYSAQLEGHEAELPALPVQYADYAAWQRRLLTGELRQRQVSYWRERLADAPTTLALPTDRPRGPVQTFDGGVRRFTLDGACTAALRASARATHTTLFMNLLAVLGVLLSRWSAQEELLVGTPVAARQRPELEGLIGLFVNTLVLRLDLGGEPDFRGLLERVRGICLDAYAHQDLPFEQLVEELAPARQPSQAPLFQVMLAMQNAALPHLRLRDLEVEAIPSETGMSKFDLTLTVVEEEDTLQCELEYNRDLFDAATVERLAAHYARLAAQLCAAPDRPVTRVPLLDALETRELVEVFNATAVAFEPQPVHRYLERRAALEPARPAVSRGERSLCQAELHGHANALARFLIERGAGRGRVVALHMERSLELVVAILATLKTGAAYVPLPRSTPPQRVVHALRDSGAVLLLGDPGTPAVDGCERHVIDLAWIEGLDHARGDLDVPVQPDDLCYVIYTSGSTGLPKGAAVRHSGQANTMTWFTTAFDVSAEDRYLLLSSIGFDLTQKSLFGPLAIGAEVVLPLHDEFDPRSLRRTIRERRVSVLTCTPTAFYALLGDGGEEELSALGSLRHVVLGGEPINVHRLLPWKNSPYCRATFSNSYGPTECSDIVAAHVLTDEDFRANRPVPIGRPIRNVQLYVVDRYGALLPRGCVGELWIGGVGVGPGYVAAPELNAERFVEAAFAPPDGRRVYRTGDLARQRADGTLEYLGRQDHQVKIRGLRIEPGEIEATLEAHPAVRACALVVHGREGEPDGLAAYVARRPDQAAVGAAELRAHLRERLPAYMLPQWWVFMETLPTNPNGKIDRLALPAPGEDDVIQRAYVEPRGGIERTVADIFAAVTGVARVGREDDFFELGGHSLLALRVLAQVHAACGVELPLPELFAHSSVAALSALVERRMGAAAAPVIPVRDATQHPLSFAQEAMWSHARAWGVGAAYNMAYRFEARGQLDVQALEAALQHLVRRHRVLRSRVNVEAQGVSMQVVDEVGELLRRVDVPGADLDQRRAAAARLADEEALREFDLERELPLRASLMALGEREHLLCLTLHHMAFDAWSERILVDELSAAYAAFHAGRTPAPAPAPPQFGDFAAWQRAASRPEEQAHNRVRLHAFLDSYELVFAPRVRQGAARTPRFDAARLTFELPGAGLAGARRLARGAGASTFTVLCALWARTLCGFAGRERVLLNVPFIERPTAELQRALGLYMWNQHLYLAAGAERTLADVLTQVREQIRAGLAFVPFADIIHELPQPPNALTEIVFNQIDVPAPAALRWPALELRPPRHGSAAYVRSFYTLQVALRDYAGTPMCDITWRRDCLEDEQAQALGDAYRAALAQLDSGSESVREPGR